MKKIFLSAILLVSSGHVIFGQGTFVNKQYGFSMQSPKDWLVANNEQLEANLKEFEL